VVRWLRSHRRALSCLFAVFLLPPAAVSPQLPPSEGEWAARPGSRVTVYHHPRHEPLAARVLVFLEQQRPLPGLPADVPSGVSAFLAPDVPSFESLTGGHVPEWSGGVAIPSLRMLVVPLYVSGPLLDAERARVLRHEWAHLGLHQFLDGLRSPRWFDEGYAEWAAGWDRSEAWRLRLLLLSGRAPPLDSLTLEWPRDAASARAAYLLAATAVEYLVRESGERGLELFLARWKEGGSFEASLLTTYGVTPGQFELHWRRYVKDRYGWFLVLSQTTLIWAFLAVLLLLLVRVRRRRDREHMARLRATEVPEGPAYWAGDEGDDERGAPAGDDRPL